MVPVKIRTRDVPLAEKEPDEGDAKVRRMRLAKSDFEKHGITPGCKGCRNIEIGSYARDHSDERRIRMEKAIGQSEEGKVRIGNAYERMNERVAAEMEKMDEPKNSAGSSRDPAPQEVELETPGERGTDERGSGRSYARKRDPAKRAAEVEMDEEAPRRRRRRAPDEPAPARAPTAKRPRDADEESTLEDPLEFGGFFKKWRPMGPARSQQEREKERLRLQMQKEIVYCRQEKC